MATVSVWSIQKRWKRDSEPTRSTWTPELDPMACEPSELYSPHSHTQEQVQSVWQSFYLIVASKTWTVESLSKETVLITNLTAFWNSDEFPIIFKKRNTSHYDGMKWRWGYMIAGAGPRHLNICTCCGFATHGSRNRKPSYLLEHNLGQTASPFPPNSRTRRQNFDNNSS